jgi:hypothetical protein
MHGMGWRIALFVTLGVLTGCGSAGNTGANPQASAGQVIPPADESVVAARIMISGSTNTTPVTIAVAVDGSATVTTATGTRTMALPASTTATFFSDLAQAEPLSSLPTVTACAKPVSFATTTTVSAGAQVTPDLTCPATPLESSLRSDIDAILTLAEAS